MASLQSDSGEGGNLPEVRRAEFMQLDWASMDGLDADPQYNSGLNVDSRWKLYELAEPPRDLVGETLGALEQFRLPKDSTIMDLGCGNGRDLHRLRGVYPEADLFGIDTSGSYAATEAEIIASGIKRIFFMSQKVETYLPMVPDEYLTAVLCMFSLYHFDEPEEILKHIRRILEPDGKVAIATLDPTNKPKHRAFEARIAEELGIDKPPVNHAAFNSATARKVLPQYFDLIEAVPPQRSPVRVRTEEDVQRYLASVDSMRGRFNPVPFPGQSQQWFELLDRLVGDEIRRVIDREGVFEDFAARDVFIGTPKLAA